MPDQLQQPERISLEEELPPREIKTTQAAPQTIEPSKVQVEANEEKLAMSSATKEDIKGETAEKFIQPMELEENEPIPRRRGNFKTDALSQKVKEISVDPNEGVAEGTEKVKMVLENTAAAVLHHVPGVGLVAVGIAKRKVVSEIKETAEQFQLVNQTRMKLLSQQPHSVLDIPRGVEPASFWENGKKLGVNLLLANTLEYAALQLQHRFEKLHRSSAATDIQTVGAGVSASIIGAPIGIGIASVGTAMKGFQALKSVVTFIKKLNNGTLGVERNQHASLLFGLALEYLQFNNRVVPRRDLDAVGKSLNFVSALGDTKDRIQARQQAFQMLQKLGIAPDPKDQTQIDRFNQSGFEQIRKLLQH